MKNLVLLLGLASTMFVTSSCTDHEGEGTLPQVDREFMLKAADGSLFEIMAGEIAAGKAMHEMVRHYGEHMVMDHTKATQEQKALAQMKNMDLPETVSEIKKMRLDSLSAMNGMAFDSLYMHMMVVSHKETIELFKMEAGMGKDKDVVEFAAGKLPNLRHHLDKAVELKEQL